MGVDVGRVVLGTAVVGKLVGGSVVVVGKLGDDGMGMKMGASVVVDAVGAESSVGLAVGALLDEEDAKGGWVGDGVLLL